MKNNSFKKTFDKFLQENVELIEKYELECNDVFEDNYEGIYELCSKIENNRLNIGQKTVIKTALNNAISCKCNILDCLNDIITLVNDNNFTEYSINQYFKEVNDIYTRNNNNYDIVFCEENADQLIHMNLKSVIAVAKRYQNLGLDLDDLIQAGNEGLVVCAKGDEKTHIPKYDPSRAKLKDKMLEKASELPDIVKCKDIFTTFEEFLTYGDVLKKFKKDFVNSEYKKQDIIRWIRKNIYNAKFNSVANMWIRAYIINELNDNSRTVKKPKSEIDRDVRETGSYKKEVKVDIDAPIGGDGTRTIGDTLSSDCDEYTDLEVGEAQDFVKFELNRLLTGVKPRDRAVFLKKYGIGLPRPMQPKEIAEQEGLSIARVSQIFQTVEQQIINNQIKYNIDISKLISATKLLR